MRPETEAELSEMIRAATGPLSVRGGATRGAVSEGEPLETGGMSGITLYEPGALTLVAGAGTPLSEIEAALAGENQRLAFEPMDHRGLLGTNGVPTVGGVFAANVSGPRRVQTGAARDFALGVRFVDGRGTVVKNGGRVMKNVAGYDLVKLICGSRGTLGVLTELAMKVLPEAETQATLRLERPDPASAVAAMAAALASPFEVTGAAYAGGAVLIRIEGFADSVAYRAGRLQERLKDHGAADVLDAAASAQTWRDVRDVNGLASEPGDIWRLSARPSQAPEIVARLEAETLLDWGGGLIWARVPEGTDLRARAGTYDGHATLVRAAPETHARLSTLQPEPAAVRGLSAGLRARFDPRGILNPGLTRPSNAT